KLSKRDPEANALGYRDAGFLPEGLLNYVALPGWAIADDRDVFALEEMAEVFDISRVNPHPARFDLKKCEAVNAAHVRAHEVDELAERILGDLQLVGMLAVEPTGAQRAMERAATPLVQERMVALGEAPKM